MSFEIKLPLFEGPFDLLLFFIERDELDIYDIPISRITNEFNEYLKQLELLKVEIASEFIVVAATLIRIKAKMLLPRLDLDENGQEIDPRADLVRHLLEYKKFKQVTNELASLEEIRLSLQTRGNITKELTELALRSQTEIELQTLDLYKLMRVFENVMKKAALEQSKPRHIVVQYPYTIEAQKEVILEKLEQEKRISFEDFLKIYSDKIILIFTFLAILEMVQLQVITLTIGEGYNNFWLEFFKGE